MRLVLFIAWTILFGALFYHLMGEYTEVWYVQLPAAAFLGCAVFCITWQFSKNPPALPFAPSLLNDRGHNVYAVANEKARLIVGQMVEKAGYRLQGTFTAGPTNQRLYGSDIVLMLFGPAPEKEPNYDPERLPFIARSLVMKDPKMASWELCNQLEEAGHKAEVHTPLPDHEDKFFMVTSDAFIGGWGIAFRPWGPKMGKPESWTLGK